LIKFQSYFSSEQIFLFRFTEEQYPLSLLKEKKRIPYLLGVFFLFVYLKCLHAEKTMKVAAEGSDLHCFLCRLI